MEISKAANPENEIKILKTLEDMFNMAHREIEFDINENEKELIVFGFTKMFDQVTVSIENIYI